MLKRDDKQPAGRRRQWSHWMVGATRRYWMFAEFMNLLGQKRYM